MGWIRDYGEKILKMDNDQLLDELQRLHDEQSEKISTHKNNFGNDSVWIMKTKAVIAVVKSRQDSPMSLLKGFLKKALK